MDAAFLLAHLLYMATAIRTSPRQNFDILGVSHAPGWQSVLVPDRILILERAPGDSDVWSFGLGDADGRLPAQPYRLRHSPTSSQPPTSGDWREESLWVAAILFVRQTGDRDRIVYNLSAVQVGDALSRLHDRQRPAGTVRLLEE